MLTNVKPILVHVAGLFVACGNSGSNLFHEVPNAQNTSSTTGGNEMITAYKYLNEIPCHIFRSQKPKTIEIHFWVRKNCNLTLRFPGKACSFLPFA